jgi:hypothetical protein
MIRLMVGPFCNLRFGLSLSLPFAKLLPELRLTCDPKQVSAVPGDGA